ncbi:DnaJ domain-containing protein, putative [Eimeria acervulina]|uniref:DnaJ domain-containing protein, putative n=1 Tax=Eimeria acervulina TaxID=5801 RepID=U6GC97_EIMAC|nr:DnaJ domain-containing protein, putative [Eimeria acervulina]CDI76204.1 DnaJ domain-containing protein, putative [Eimeria acervulina]
MKRLLMLCDADVAAGDTLEPFIALSLCTVTRRIEPAGRSFQQTYEQREAPKHPRKSDSSGGGSSLASGANLRRILAYEETLYQILGVQEGASLAEIKKQYRKKVLEYHPDKAKSGAASPPANPAAAATDTAAAAAEDATAAAADGPPAPAAEGQPASEHEAFLRLQEAYEALSDSNFRRQYDSALPFDEKIPSAADCSSPADFYKVFGEAFVRNSRWSVRRPVPELGDSSTPLTEVEKFYSFWFAFESWRDFSVHDEHDLGTAECREERRDPRIKQQKEEERRKKEEAKAARLRAREEEKRAEEERKRREEEEARSKEEEAQRVLQQQQQERAALRKWSLSAGEAEEGLLSPLHLQDLSGSLGLVELQQFIKNVHQAMQLQLPIEDEAGEPVPLPEDLNLTAEQRRAALNLYSAEWEKYIEAKRQKDKAAEEEMQRIQEEKRRQDLERKKAQQTVWTVEELSLLAKALQKYPGGTSRRWHQVAAFVGTKTQEEVVQKAKEMNVSANLKTMGTKISQVRS